MAFNIDLHTHTFFSGDGVSSPEENVAAAREKGLHGFAITDHNTCAAITYLLKKGLMREGGSNHGRRPSPLHRRDPAVFERQTRPGSLRNHPRTRRPRHSTASLRSL